MNATPNVIANFLDAYERIAHIPAEQLEAERDAAENPQYSLDEVVGARDAGMLLPGTEDRTSAVIIPSPVEQELTALTHEELVNRLLEKESELERAQGQIRLLGDASLDEPTKAELEPRFDDLGILDEFTSTSWLIDEVILEGGLGQVVAEPGVGKTLWAIDMALHIASGKTEWMGYEINNEGKPKNVVYIAAEGGDVFKSFLQGWFLGHPEVNRDDVRPYFKFIDGAKGYEVLVGDEALKEPVAYTESLDRLKAEIEELDESPALIVFDTQIDILGMLNENDNQQIGRAFKKLKAFAEHFDAYALMVHHMKKDGGYRGAGAQLGKADLQVELKRNGNSGIVETDFKKIKGAPMPYKNHAYKIETAWTPKYKHGKVVMTFENVPEKVSVPYIVDSKSLPALTGAELMDRVYPPYSLAKLETIQRFIGTDKKSKTAIATELGADRKDTQLALELESMAHDGYLVNVGTNGKTAYKVQTWIQPAIKQD